MDIIIFKNDGVVCAMFPVLETGLSIEEIAKKDVPEGVDYYIVDSADLPDEPQETWLLNNGIVTVDTDALNAYQLNAADRQRSALTSVATQAITPLQYAADLEEATDTETELLKKWKQYIVALNRLDMSAAPDISWPETPTI